MSEALAARRYLRAQSSGVLATQSQRHPGYPFASAVPFALDCDAQPVILVSALAEHAKNLAADRKLSLIAHQPAGDVQAQPRITLIGEAEPIARDHPAAQRYVRYIPGAGQLLALTDFSFYRVRIAAALYIAGFARVHWIEAAQFAALAGSLAEEEADVLAHMNGDHSRNLRDYCRHVHGIEPQEVSMIGLDCDGFDALADGQRLRFEFTQPVLNAQDARRELVALAERSRGE